MRRRLCLGTKEGLSNSREELAGGRQAHPLLEAGGGGEGKGANSAPEMASPTKLQTGSQFLTKDKDSGWLTSAGRVAARDQLPRTDTRRTQPACAETEAGTAERIRRTLGECARQAPGCLSCSGQGRHKTQARTSLRFCGVPENWNRTQFRARSL